MANFVAAPASVTLRYPTLHIGVARLPKHSLRFYARGSQIGDAGFGFAALTSRLALRASPSVKLIWLPKIRYLRYEKRTHKGSFFVSG